MTSKVIFSFLPKKKVILSGMGFIGFLIFVLLIRLTFLSSIYYANGVEALKSGDRDKAFLSYTWAVRNYYPGNPFIQKSVLGALGIIQAESLEGKKKTRNYSSERFTCCNLFNSLRFPTL